MPKGTPLVHKDDNDRYFPATEKPGGSKSEARALKIAEMISSGDSVEAVAAKLKMQPSSVITFLALHPAIAESVHGSARAKALGERVRNVEALIAIRDAPDTEPGSKIRAIDALDARAGVQLAPDGRGNTTVIIHGEKVDVNAIGGGDLDTLIRTLAKRAGSEVESEVEATLAGKDHAPAGPIRDAEFVVDFGPEKDGDDAAGSGGSGPAGSPAGAGAAAPPQPA